VEQSVAAWRAAAREALRQSGVSAADLEVQVLAAAALGKDRTYVLTHGDAPIPNSAHELLGRRLRGEPLAYILGYREFCGRSFSVHAPILVPRHETEHVVETALARFDGQPRCVVDAGCGSGIIGVTLALERPNWRVLGIDRSKAATRLTKANASALGARVEVVLGDWLGAIADGCVDLVVTNPPYIVDGFDLPDEVARWESPEALYAGPDGLAAYRILARQAARVLRPGGALVGEIGFDQGGSASDLFRAQGWKDVRVETDLAGHPRVIVAHR
jgi:release factor glutamine methyltransferase